MTKLWDAELPGEKDWASEYFDDLDYKYAFKKLLGKNKEEAVGLIKFNSLSYVEYLGLMTPKVFRFYFKALVEYLLSDDSKGESAAADSMFGLIKYDIESGLNKAEELKSFLPPILKRVAERQEFYDADVDIYGDFNVQAEEVIALIQSRGQGF